MNGEDTIVIYVVVGRAGESYLPGAGANKKRGTTIIGSNNKDMATGKMNSVYFLAPAAPSHNPGHGSSPFCPTVRWFTNYFMVIYLIFV